MIEPIIFNKYINLIGVEFEGCYDIEFKKWCNRESGSELIYDIKGDGSVRCMNNSEYARDLIPAECVTNPLNGEQLTRVLDIWDDKFQSADYTLNASTGLHFHVSLKKQYYAYIDNQEFYDEFVEMFRADFPKIYEERANTHYCKVNHSDQHFTLESRDRYASVNYCYKKHGTVEFRAYGGTYASIKGLGVMIQKTINLIGQFIDRKEEHLLSFCRKVEHEYETKAYAKIRSYRIEKSEPIFFVLNIEKKPTRRPMNGSFKTFARNINLSIDLSQ